MPGEELRKKFRPDPENLLLILTEIQNCSRDNSIRDEDIAWVAEYLNITLSAVYGVVKYYSLFSTVPRGRYVIRVCRSPVCRMMGAETVANNLESLLGVRAGVVSGNSLFSFEKSECLGQCEKAPSMMVNSAVYGRLTRVKIERLLSSLEKGSVAGTALVKAEECRIALKNIDRPEASIEEYEASGGLASLRKALAMDPGDIIDELMQANLRGRGGAGFSAGLKERYTSAASHYGRVTRYIVCNGDEGEPGTFKDRVIMEKDPHLFIEGMIIAAYAIDAARGFIYIRGEYATCIETVTRAVRSFYDRGYLGKNIGGSGYSLELSVKPGAGSYLCGEELTLLESLEGRRGYPRIKPPFPAESGLWGAPTLVNNVETFTHIPWIIEHGAKSYTSIGTKGSPGTKIFTLSGDVQRPGYYELEMGQTLRTLLEDFGQGMAAGKSFKAALLGGAAGTFVDHTFLDVPLTYDDLKSRGAVLGSGAVVILAEERSLFEMVLSIMEFFQHESCGKCVPCRVGTTLLVEMMKREGAEQRRGELLKRMLDEAEFMARSSLCPLGQSPVLSLRSLYSFFRNAF